MKIEIDQSGKIEQTNRLAVVGFANGRSGTIIISAKEKQLVRSQFRKVSEPRVLIYKMFSALIYLLIRDYIDELDQIVIDREYPGHERLIKDHLTQLIRINKPTIDPEIIYFKEIG